MKTVNYYYDLLVDEAKILQDIGQLSNATYRHYIVRKNRICLYLQHLGNDEIYPKDINMLWVKQYENWLLKMSKSGNRNVINKHIQHLGKVLRYAVMDNEIQHNPITDYKYKYNRAVKLQYLTLTQLSTFKDVTLPPHLARVRDLYVFSCYTGLSYIDVMTFTPDCIVRNQHGEFIVKSRSKTNNESCIVLLDPVRQILNRYDYRLPRLSNQKYNKYLKIAFEHVGIFTKLTTHSARKTFAMLMHNEYGLPLDTVSKMLGHTSVQTTQAWYAKTDFQKVAKDMKEVVRKLAS